MSSSCRITDHRHHQAPSTKHERRTRWKCSRRKDYDLLEACTSHNHKNTGTSRICILKARDCHCISSYETQTASLKEHCTRNEAEMTPQGNLCDEKSPSAEPTNSSDIHFGVILENQHASSKRDRNKTHPSLFHGPKYPESNRKSRDERAQRLEPKAAERTNSLIQRDIRSTKSNRDLMRQISGLGMVDPVYGTREASPLHQSIIFDDMSLGDIPDDFKDVISVASDHTATDGNGFDSTIFNASLQFNADEHDLPSLDGSSVSKSTKKQSRKGIVSDTPLIDFDSLLSGNGRSTQSKASNLKTRSSKPPHPHLQNTGSRSKPREISVKPLSSKEAYRAIPASAESLFPKQTIHNTSQVSGPSSPRKVAPSKTHNFNAPSPRRKLPSIAQIFPEGRPPRDTKETKPIDSQKRAPDSLSSPKL